MGWVEKNDVKFINPYNFVSLGGEVERADIDDAKREVTGYISCTLTTKTPLAILDHEYENVRKEQNEHKIYDFFKVNGKPVIPGSEIRGVIRSAYEAVTNSCMSVCNVSILSARHPFPRNPGILIFQDDHWELYEADKYMLKTSDRGNDKNNIKYDVETRNGRVYIKGTNYTTGSVVKFNAGNQYIHIDKKTGKKREIGSTVYDICSGTEGVLLLWEYIENKHHNSIFVKQDKYVACDNLDKAVDDFAVLMDMYIEHDEIYKQYQYTLKKDGNMYPVWYESVGRIIYLSPACISRTVFDNRLEDLIGSHKKCTNRNDLCPACRLFGMIGETSLGSRLRFADAHTKRQVTADDYNTITLKELANPKTTAVEFYTYRPRDAQTWNYDYKTTGYTMNRGKAEPVRQLAQTQIRGRKFYFHGDLRNENEARTRRNSTVSLLKPDIAFSFKLYFDGISNNQLKQLVWLLCIGENQTDGKMRHKIGHGKPIGLGSVKITVDEVMTRKIAVENDLMSYITEKPDVAEMMSPIPFSDRSDYFKDFMKMTNSETTKGKNVSYPIGDDGRNGVNSTASHQWFIGNRMMGDGARGMQHHIARLLPFLSDDLELPKLVFLNDRQNNNHNNNVAVNARNNNRPRSTAVPAAPITPAPETSKYQPIEIKCKTCGEIFIYTPEEQAKHEQMRIANPTMNIGSPKNCPKCRQKKEKNK